MGGREGEGVDYHIAIQGFVQDFKLGVGRGGGGEGRGRGRGWEGRGRG